MSSSGQQSRQAGQCRNWLLHKGSRNEGGYVTCNPLLNINYITLFFVLFFSISTFISVLKTSLPAQPSRVTWKRIGRHCWFILNGFEHFRSLNSPPGPSGLPYSSQFCRDCSLVRLCNTKRVWVKLVWRQIYLVTEGSLIKKHIRGVGFGNSHERRLVSAFVRVILERQDAVLFLYFRQWGALEETDSFRSTASFWAASKKTVKSQRNPKRWDSIFTKAKVQYLADKKLDCLCGTWEHEKKTERFNLACVHYRVQAQHFVWIILLVLSVQFGHLVRQQQEHNPAK